MNFDLEDIIVYFYYVDYSLNSKSPIKTNKQKKFVDEYLIDLNATQAAIRAGYSKKTAGQIGTENLFKPYIKEAIQKRQEKDSIKAGITREEIIEDLRNIKDQFKGEKKYPPHAMRAIEILNKMLGFNATEKTELKIIGEQPLFTDDEDGGE
jgi:phage terminase small subunit